MRIIWKEKYNDVAAKAIQAFVDNRRDHEGEECLDLFGIMELASFLKPLTNVDKAKLDFETDAMFFQALDQTELTSKTFLDSLNESIREFKALPTQRYMVITSVSLHLTDTRVYRIAGSSLRFTKKLPKKYETRSTEEPQVQDYPTYVMIPVDARNYKEALSVGEHLAEQQRAIWTFVSKNLRAIGHREKESPTFGAIHFSSFTVHSKNGSREEYHYFDEYRDIISATLSRDEEILAERVHKCLTRCPYRETILGALGIYQMAMDEEDPQKAFLTLWTALESLTTPNQAVYDTLIKRCLFLQQNKDYHASVLAQLKAARNDLIHRALPIHDARIKTYQIQDYFRDIAWYHLNAKGAFPSLNNGNLFLDMDSLTNIDKTYSYLRHLRPHV